MEGEIIVRSGTIAEAKKFEPRIFGSSSDPAKYEQATCRVVVGSIGPEIVSFLVTYVRDGRIYIWLCGSLPKVRQRGLLAEMLRLVLPTYQEENVFVKTYPKFYQDMFRWLDKRKFVSEGEIVPNSHPERGPFVQYGTTKKDLLARL